MENKNPYILTFILKQHTPLIHFQHDQAGATLRATEVKPKLDRFLLSKYRNGIDKKWYVGAGTSGERKDALAFQFSIRPKSGLFWTSYIERPKFDEYERFKRKKDGNGTETNSYPSFFGNMGKFYEEVDTIKKFIFHPDGLEVTINSFHTGLISFIKSHLAEFFATYNFGTRQTKGFGSFYLQDLNEFPLKSADWCDYKIEIPFPAIQKFGKNATGLDYDKMFSAAGFFQKLDWFYRCLRGGINLKTSTGADRFYFKSLLFLYFKSLGVQWEKKTIKEQFYSTDWKKIFPDGSSKTFIGLTTQQSKRSASEALSYSNSNKKLVKDLFGLSSEEAWLSYQSDTITKAHKKSKFTSGEGKEISRFASPIIFKPIELNPGTMTVFIRFEETGLKRMIGETFNISSKRKSTSIRPPLEIPKSFSLDGFFKFLTNPANFNISTHVDSKFHNEDEYKSLAIIFHSLTRLKP